jgi:hypothetical protein
MSTLLKICFEQIDKQIELFVKWNFEDIIQQYVNYFDTKTIIEKGLLLILQWMYERKYHFDNKLINIAASNGHLDIVKWIYEKTDNISIYNEKIISHAANNGHLDIIKWAITDPYFTVSPFILIDAAENGHLHILKWAYENQQTLFKTTIYSIICSIIENGHLNIFKWIQENINFDITDNLLNKIVEHKQLHILKWILPNIRVDKKIIQIIVDHGQIDIIEYLYNDFAAVILSNKYDISLTISNSRVDMIKWLYEKNLIYDKEYSFKEIIRLNDIDLIRLFYKKEYNFMFRALTIEDYKNCDIEIFKFLIQNVDTFNDILAFNSAIVANNFDIVNYYQQFNLPVQPFTLAKCLKNDNIEMVKWLIACDLLDINSLFIMLNIVSLEMFKLFVNYNNIPINLLGECAYNINNYKLLKYAYEHGAILYSLNIDKLTKKGNLDILKLIFKYQKTRFIYKINSILNIASQYGHINIIDWMNAKKMIKYFTELFINAIKYNQFELVKWLYNKFSSECKENLMDLAVLSGNVEIVAWMFDNLSIEYNNEYLESAILNDNLSIIKYFIRHDKKEVSEIVMYELLKKRYLCIFKYVYVNCKISNKTEVYNAAKNSSMFSQETLQMFRMIS